ncbi:orcokinin peptides isoform X2 [Microplitis demolitor]|uniref:orcokinin peptides isoform X2 n=1 Tax=Microplitis demolitor TaxID=69319 RepID=UPI0004CD4112|nr:orcokinin peptides isoform X2 [Microplitis demolitor]
MMTTRFIGSAFIFAAITCIFAVPIQLHDETMGLNEGVYTQPELAEALARSYAALGAGRIQNSRDETRAHFRQPSRLNPGLTFENRDSDLRRKSGWPITVNGMEIYEGSLKRNIDEIDRTGFDNFVKRNFDEIDRSGWDSFVKRRIANAYLAARQH